MKIKFVVDFDGPVKAVNCRARGGPHYATLVPADKQSLERQQPDHRRRHQLLPSLS